MFVPSATCSPLPGPPGQLRPHHLGRVHLHDYLPLEVASGIEAQVGVGRPGEAVVAYDAIGDEVPAASRYVVHAHRLPERADLLHTKAWPVAQCHTRVRDHPPSQTDQVRADAQVVQLRRGARLSAPDVLPAASAQEAVLGARDQPRAVLERHDMRRLDARPLVFHGRDGKAPFGAVANGPVDALADPYLAHRLRAPVGHQDVCVARDAIAAGMAASPVGVDRPAERHRRALGHPVEHRFRLDLVEAHVHRLGSLEAAHRGWIPIAGQTLLCVQVACKAAPPHEHMFAQTPLERHHYWVSSGRTGLWTLRQVPLVSNIRDREC